MSDRLAPHLIAYHAEKLEALREEAPQSEFDHDLLAYAKSRGPYLEIPEAQVSQGPRETLLAFRLAREILDTQARTFKALTAGPNWWFDTFSDDLLQVVTRAFNQRTAEWQGHFDEEASIREDRNLDRYQRQAALYQQEADTKEQEKELLLQAYQEALATPDYRPGQFAALWVILMYTRTTWWKNQSRFFTLPIYTLEFLPWEELQAYHSSRPSPPVAMARAQRRVNLSPGTKCSVQVSGEAQQTRYHLLDEAGEPMIRGLCRVPPPARTPAGVPGIRTRVSRGTPSLPGPHDAVHSGPPGPGGPPRRRRSRIDQRSTPIDHHCRLQPAAGTPLFPTHEPHPRAKGPEPQPGPNRATIHPATPAPIRGLKPRNRKGVAMKTSKKAQPPNRAGIDRRRDGVAHPEPAAPPGSPTGTSPPGLGLRS